MDALKGYAQQEVIYEGVETRVVRAVQEETGTRVALKMASAAAPSQRVVGRLAHEYRMLSKLQAVPGVIRAVAFEQQGLTALVLEDPGFESLDRVLSGNRHLPLEVGLRLGALIARVLHGVHAAGVMHKDIKPQNILTDAEFSQVRLLDFGIASWLSQEATEASIPEALEGTLSYISPEQTGRTARVLDSRTDLYSLGVTLFQVLSGQLPFAESDPLALVHAHLAKEPPHLDAIRKEIPHAVARVLVKLLAKDPEQRYQTAQGAAEDLEEAWRQWTQDGKVELFPLGKKDFSIKLRLPQMLVGREHEVEALRGAFNRVSEGGVELLLIAGPSGIGKTALVRTVYKDIAKAGRGLLISGKHDQLARSTPYGAMAQAFGGLMRQWLASSESVLKGWQERIRRGVGDNARLIADAVPELDLVMGKLPPVPPVQGDQVLNRLKLTWLNFVRTVTEPSAPLVMFLDDMQWADSATLEMIQTLLTDPDRASLLIIAAYRDNETPPEHPLWKLYEAVNKSGTPIPRITVEPLTDPQVQQWLARALECSLERVEPLAKVLWQKTRGNPFFVEQLLLSLHRQKQLLRDAATGQWEWNQQELEQAQVTDNVVALLLAKVRELPDATQHLLGLAACAGHQFHLEELERLTGWSRKELTEALLPALAEELVVPVDGEYRMAQALSAAGGPGIDAAYRFLHDRVQQASYERIAPAERASAHLEIGRRLWTRYRAAGGTVSELLDVTRHLNLGAEGITSADERGDLAQLNLQAARAAKAASSHPLMVSLLETAQGLLGPTAWMEKPMLATELLLERLEGAFLLRDFADVEARAQTLLAMPLPLLPRLVAHELRVRTCLASGQLLRGKELALPALEEVGIHLPATDEEAAGLLMAEVGDVAQWFFQNPNAFDEMPFDPSIEHLLGDALLAQAGLACANLGQAMTAALAATRMVAETRKRNALTPVAPFMIATFASIWSVATGQHRQAAMWVAPGERAARRVGCPMLAECLASRGSYSVYFNPVDDSVPVYEEAIALGLKSGSFQGQSWALMNDILYHRLWRAQPLWQVEQRVRSLWAMVQRAWDPMGKNTYELAASWCHLLMDPAQAENLLKPEPLERGSRPILADGNGFVAENARMLEGLLFLIVGNYPAALARMTEAEQFNSVIYGTPPVTLIPLYRSLAAAKCWPGAMVNETPESLRAIIDNGLARFRYFAEGCADNFLHKLRLIEAESARVEGRMEEAMAKYDEAIELARKQRFHHIAGLAAQFCGEYHIAAGRGRLGMRYLSEAREDYSHWGALSIVAHLEAKYPGLRKAAAAQPAPKEHTISMGATTSTTVLTSHENVHLDVSTAVRAAQTLAGELNPERVVGRLMQLVLENAGAQRGVLVLSHGEQLTIVARLSVQGGVVATALNQPLAGTADVPEAAIHYVARTRESLVLHDTQSDARWESDPHFRTQGIRSALVIPLLHQGRLGGVLYVEHALPEAFPAGRVSLLGVLAAQGAIALENAQLYADLQRLNQGLEAQVAARTAELQKALSELWSEMDLAKKIQTVLLPPDGIYLHYDIAAIMKPADNVGGDYYDVIKVGDELWVLIGDVSGHGISAGLIMMMVQVAVRALAGKVVHGEAMRPSRLLGYVNAAVRPNLGKIGRGQYMTLTAFCIKGNQVLYGGLHLDPLVYRAASGKVERQESQGIWLGIVDDMDALCEDQKLELQPGDVLFLYTDGLVESTRNGQMIGMDPPTALLTEQGNLGASSSQIATRVLSVLDGALRDDDVTVMALRHIGSR